MRQTFSTSVEKKLRATLVKLSLEQEITTSFIILINIM